MALLLRAFTALLFLQAAAAYVHPAMTLVGKEVTKHHEAPAPTPPARGLARRQDDITGRTYTQTLAPDSVCGYLSASPGNDIVCENGERCSWVKSNGLNAVFCGFKNGTAKLQCFERDALAADPGSCNDVCQSNRYNLQCTDEAAPYCRTYAYPEGIRDYRCASTPVSVVQSVDFTYEGQIGRQFETNVVSNGVRTSSGSSQGSTTPTSSKTGSISASTSDPLPDPTSKGSSVPIGAIVGGVVGGVAVIALVIFAIIFLRRRSKKNKNSPPDGHGASPPVQQVYVSADQQPFPLPSPSSELDGGSKSGMVSPFHPMSYRSSVAPTYDGQASMDMRPYSPESQSGYQQPAVYEMGHGGEHHRGELHELH